MLPEAALLRQKRVIRDTGGLVFRDPIELGPRQQPSDLAGMVVEEFFLASRTLRVTASTSASDNWILRIKRSFSLARLGVEADSADWPAATKRRLLPNLLLKISAASVTRWERSALSAM
jgi:hypothetical protein